jgi:hypothetical protein
MIPIKGYEQVEYTDFKAALQANFTKSKKTKLQIASEIKVDSTNSVRNTFTDVKQTSSDKVLTSVMKAVGLSGFVIWIFGKKYYYIKK